MDSNGLECDSVIHLRNGKYGLVERRYLCSTNIKFRGLTRLSYLKIHFAVMAIMDFR